MRSSYPERIIDPVLSNKSILEARCGRFVFPAGPRGGRKRVRTLLSPKSLCGPVYTFTPGRILYSHT
jgi:hypothetical protein